MSLVFFDYFMRKLRSQGPRCASELAELNKGEARNALARAVCFHRLGRLRDRAVEAQQYRASGLALVTAAIALWNTVYLDRALNDLRRRPGACCRPSELSSITSPKPFPSCAGAGECLFLTEARRLEYTRRAMKFGRRTFLDPLVEREA